MTIQQPVITGTKKVHVAWTNTDLTEGRGFQVPLHVCASRAMAIRMGEQGTVQGCDCEVTEVDAFMIAGHWYAPQRIMEPQRSDIEADKAYSAKTAAIKRAKTLGLSDEEINALVKP